MRGGVEILVGREDAEVIEVVRGAGIVPVRVLELAEVVERVDLLEGYLRGWEMG